MKRISRIVIYFGFVAAVMAFRAAICTAADTAKDDSKSDASQADLKVIKPEEAKDYEGQDVAVEFDVASSRELGTGLCFLNSLSDYSDPSGFTVVISPKGLSKIKEDSKIEKPADYYKTKKVRVTGKVVVYQKDKDSPKKYEIKVDDPAQITVVEEKSGNAGNKSP